MSQSSEMARFEKLEQKRLALLERLSACTPAQLQQSPGPGQWSPVQVLAHIYNVEIGSLRYIEKKLQYRTGIPPVTLITNFRMWFMKIVLRTPLKFKAPGATATFPEELAFGQLREDWEKERKQLQQLLQTFPEELLHKAVWKHPMAGKLSLAHALEFLELHLDRHTRQIDRILP